MKFILEKKFNKLFYNLIKSVLFGILLNVNIILLFWIFLLEVHPKMSPPTGDYTNNIFISSQSFQRY